MEKNSLKAVQLPERHALEMRRRLWEKDESASYCCEAAGTLSAEKLPSEDAY